MPSTILITVVPLDCGRRYRAYFGARLLVAETRMPLLDAARELPRLGADPDAIWVDWNVVYDARGHFEEPHTNRRIGCGTIEVGNYLHAMKQPDIVSAERLGDIAGLEREPAAARRTSKNILRVQLAENGATDAEIAILINERIELMP